MIRRISSRRCVCATTSRRPALLCPMRIQRSSPTEWSGSGIVMERGSPKAVAASAKSTPCLRRFAAALARSHMNWSTPRIYQISDTAPLPNGSRLSCGAKLEYSQTELYSAECRRVTRSIEDGRRQLQAHVRRQPWLGPPHGLFCGATMRRESKIGLRCRTTGGSRRVSPRASIMTISWKKPIPRTSS